MYGSNRVVAQVRSHAKAQARARGRAAARAVAEYESFATSLAFLRRRARRGAADPDFVARELELLHHLWQRREVAGPALTYAAQATGRLRPRYIPAGLAPHPQYGGYLPNPYLPPHAQQPYARPPYGSVPPPRSR